MSVELCGEWALSSTPNTARLSFVKGASSCCCLFLPTVKRKNATDSFSPDGKVSMSVRTVNHLSDCISYTYSGRHLGCVCTLLEAGRQDLKIKLSPCRSQCKSAHCGSQSRRPETGSCVRFCCLIAGCSWQQWQVHISRDLKCEWHVVFACPVGCVVIVTKPC